MRLVTTLVIGCLAGCGGDPLSETKHVAGWATSASALGVFAIGYESIGFAEGQFQFPDPACPTPDNNGTTTTILIGGCTASNDITWTGAATVTRPAQNTLTVTFSDFGNDALGGETRTNGTMSVTEMAPDLHAFSVDVDRTGGLESEVVYTGTVRGGFQGATTWNGSGTIHRSGITINSGEVEATTVDQVRDTTVCGGEPLSGTTTLVSNEHTIVITYDGATDCTDKHTAKWTRDGDDMGSLEGITCAAGRSSAGGFALVLLALVWTCRTRRRAR